MEGKRMKDNFSTAKVIKELTLSGITLQDVSSELDYHDNSNGNRRDDNLYEFSIDELNRIECVWRAKAHIAQK
jgi:hypothetical protein